MTYLLLIFSAFVRYFVQIYRDAFQSWLGVVISHYLNVLVFARNQSYFWFCLFSFFVRWRYHFLIQLYNYTTCIEIVIDFCDEIWLDILLNFTSNRFWKTVWTIFVPPSPRMIHSMTRHCVSLLPTWKTPRRPAMWSSSCRMTFWRKTPAVTSHRTSTTPRRFSASLMERRSFSSRRKAMSVRPVLLHRWRFCVWIMLLRTPHRDAPRSCKLELGFTRWCPVRRPVCTRIMVRNIVARVFPETVTDRCLFTQELILCRI